MANKVSIVPIEKFFSQAPGWNKKYVETMLSEDIFVLCVNRDAQKKRFMPFKALYGNNHQFWQQKGGWEYFLQDETIADIKEIIQKKYGEWEPTHLDAAQCPEEMSRRTGYGSDYEAIAAMSNEERVEKMKTFGNQLHDLLSKKNATSEKITEALVDTTKNAALINHATIINAMQLADKEAQQTTHDLVVSTNEMIKSSVQLISENIFNDDLMNTLVEKSNGTIVQHMTRVYIKGLAFLTYYNKIVSTSSIINKLRVTVGKRYAGFYCTLLPHVHPKDMTLERIFYGGMRAISYEFFNPWAIGFLVHDIGKAAAVEYHEGEEAYNRDIVIEHVKLGYNSIMNKTNYPREVGLIAGYHHEYYGDSSGYGFFRTYLENYKKINPAARQDYCISYELAPMMDYKAKAYFPAKVLEIIDIYDSLTDSSRKYRKAMTPEEALVMMRDEFIKKNRKIDPILFDIFASFVRKEN